MFDLLECVKGAKIASYELNKLTEEKIVDCLKIVAREITANSEALKIANAIDVDNAKKANKSESFIDRLKLTDSVIQSMADGILQVASLDSPRNQTTYSYINELQKIDVKKINVPFGVIGIIYESRPNVTADAFALCFRTANAVVLKGGSDAINSNKAIIKVIKKSLKECKINENSISLIEDTSRETAGKFMTMNEYVDLLIPRGSGALIDYALKNATIPIIQTGKGNCHVYVDEFANVEKAVNVVFNAKTQRYSVCNACESLVINSKISQEVLPKIAQALFAKQVEIYADERAKNVIKDYPYLFCAKEEDYFEEYGRGAISIKTVDTIEQAIEHINRCSSGHSESIITENEENAQKFISEIDSSCVYHNSSTRFSDGFIFGLGAEIGISTQKLHARGPMGLEALTTTKYIVLGDGAIRK